MYQIKFSLRSQFFFFFYGNGKMKYLDKNLLIIYLLYIDNNIGMSIFFFNNGLSLHRNKLNNITYPISSRIPTYNSGSRPHYQPFSNCFLLIIKSFSRDRRNMHIYNNIILFLNLLVYSLYPKFE